VILSFIFFMILFLGGIYLMGLAQSLEDFQAIVFTGGLLITMLSLAFMMRQGGTATRRSNNWSGNATD
jgi:NADH:ubiquinone oxidoreductase subunit 6 (subunit J)